VCSCYPRSVRIDRFEDTHRLTEAELRGVLAADDAPARAFAVWALGLRSVHATHLVAQLHGEPDAGVRRALAIVLAGDGEVDLLVALARHDPDVHVRAHATQMIARFAEAERVPWSVVLERFDDVAEVRAAVVSQIRPTMPLAIRELVIRALEDPDGAVCREAFDAAVRLWQAGVAEGSVLGAALEHISPGECTNGLVHLFATSSAASVAGVLASRSHDVRERALRARPDLAATELVCLLDEALFESYRHRLGLELEMLPTDLVMRLANGATWNDEYMLEASRRIETRMVTDRGVLAKLAATCEQQVATWSELLASPDQVLDYEGVSRDELVAAIDLYERLVATITETLRAGA